MTEGGAQGFVSFILYPFSSDAPVLDKQASKHVFIILVNALTCDKAGSEFKANSGMPRGSTRNLCQI